MEWIITEKAEKRQLWMRDWQIAKSPKDLPSEILEAVNKFASIVGEDLNSFFKNRIVLYKN